MKSSLAPNTRISVEFLGTDCTGNDAFSSLRLNKGTLELSFMRSWYLYLESTHIKTEKEEVFEKKKIVAFYVNIHEN